jgi:ABC-type dipeptide/oligopeptide/nickel transport system permease subunit
VSDVAATPAVALGRRVETAPIRRASPGIWGNALARLRRDRVTLAAAIVLGIMIVLALLADFLASTFFHYTFTRQDLLNGYAKPTPADPAFWFGGDDLGRSQIVRLLYGARVSLAVGFGAAFINLTIGLALGMTSGYRRGWFDDVVQFLISTLNSVPQLPLLLIISVLFQPGPVTLVIILGLLLWPGASLFVRGQTLSLREREFIAAGQVAGGSDFHLIIKHVLPNVLPLVFVLTAIDVGTLILIESSLSFLGLGITPPTPSWGNMLSNAAQDISRGPWLVYAPGAAIFLTVLCLYLVGDGLRDALDPRLNRS